MVQNYTTRKVDVKKTKHQEKTIAARRWRRKFLRKIEISAGAFETFALISG